MVLKDKASGAILREEIGSHIEIATFASGQWETMTLSTMLYVEICLSSTLKDTPIV